MVTRKLFVLIFGFISMLALSACASSATSNPAPALATAAPTVPSTNAATTPAALAPTTAPPQTFALTSDAFLEGGNIPRKFSCDGDNVSPALKWRRAPAATKSFALILDDPDAPISGGFVHWVLFDVPANQTELSEAAKNIGRSGRNGTGRSAYAGPCPPSGTHRYFFRLYALDVVTLNLTQDATREQLLAAINGHILAQAQLMGRYSR